MFMAIKDEQQQKMFSQVTIACHLFVRDSLPDGSILKFDKFSARFKFF